MEWKYPIVRPTLRPIEDMLPMWREAWESGAITCGKFNRLLEEAVCQKTGVKCAVAVSSATNGLMMLLRALACKGEVILPSFTFTASAHAIVWNGLTPVFADVDAEKWTLDPDSVEKAITDRTSAIMAVDIFGLPADYDALMEIARKHKILLFVDSAQALGAIYKGKHVGGFTDAQVFSLSPTKVVVGAEGGIITTNDEGLANELRSMRDYGKAPDGRDILSFGLSSRLSELHAVVALKNFEVVDELVESRNQKIAYYTDNLKDIPGLSFQKVPEGYKISGIYMRFLVDPEKAPIDRDELSKRIEEKGIMTKKFFSPPVHLQTTYREIGEKYRGKLPVTERIAETDLAIPLYAHMAKGQMDEIIGAVRAAFGY